MYYKDAYTSPGLKLINPRKILIHRIIISVPIFHAYIKRGNFVIQILIKICSPLQTFQ